MKQLTIKFPQYKVVVPISGGKDSQCCLKLALLTFNKSEILGLFCDTKFEHPLTYRHIKDIEYIYGIKIETINDGTVPEKILKLRNPIFPNGVSRFCTDQLKITPSKKFYKQLAENQGGFEVWYGMRSAESNDRKVRYLGKISTDLYKPHDVISNYPKYLGKLGIRFRLPIIDLTTDQVMNILEGEENPLYKQGFNRVGCFPCLASGDKWKEKAFNHDDFGRSQYAIVRSIENKIGKSVWVSKGGKERNEQPNFQGCAICAI